jgi:hypothetical protein
MPRRSGRLPRPAKNARNLSGAPGTGKKSPEKNQQGVAARKKEKKNTQQQVDSFEQLILILKQQFSYSTFNK